MQTDSTPVLLQTLETQLHQWKLAYYREVPGVTYDDMAAAARRLLEARASYERATGRPVRSKVTKRAVAQLLR